jgi:hypothetical protein
MARFGWCGGGGRGDGAGRCRERGDGRHGPLVSSCGTASVVVDGWGDGGGGGCGLLLCGHSDGMSVGWRCWCRRCSGRSGGWWTGPAGPFADLALIETPRAQRLRRLFARTAHLLVPTEPAHSLIDILYSRVAHDPNWGPQAAALQRGRELQPPPVRIRRADAQDPGHRHRRQAHAPRAHLPDQRRQHPAHPGHRRERSDPPELTPAGTSDGHHWADLVAISGQNQWPSPGSS